MPNQWKAWTSQEIKIIKQWYPRIGPKAMEKQGMLPGRSRYAILRRAGRMNVKYYDVENERIEDWPRNQYLQKPIGISDPFLKRVVCGPWK